MRARTSSAIGLWILLGGWGAFLAAAFAGMGWLAIQRGAAPAALAQIETPSAPTGATATPRASRAPITFPPTFTRPITLSPTITRTRTPSPTVTQTNTPKPTRTPRPTSTPVFSIGQTPIVIGYSVLGRPLEVYRFGDGPIRRLIVAGIHGGYEWNTVALAEELLVYLDEHPDVVPGDITLYILRVLNPDGYARDRDVDGRVNANGVDLNRNWPSHWQANWPRSGCWIYRPVTGGSGPASEPETQALMAFILDYDIDALISYHSAALGIFAGGQPSTPDSLSLAEAVAAVSDYPYPPIDTGCQYTGQLADWAADNGVAAVDIELTNHRDTDFEQNLKILATFLAWDK
jgi:protein MpaA